MKYETDRNVEEEMDIATKAAERWGFSFSRMGEYSPFDFYFHRGNELVAVVEIKKRSRSMASYSTMFLNLDKWYTLLQAEVGLGVAGIFMAGCDDGIYFVRIGTLPVREFRKTVRGRVDRGGFNDIRPVVEVPTEFFKKIYDGGGQE